MVTKKLRMSVFFLLIVLFSSSIALAAPMTSNSTSMPKSFSTGAYSSNEVFPGISPLTGLPYDGEYRPIAVMISNAEGARPHWNLSEADIVYEGIYWGPNYTRYMAIYNDNHPELVGSVRSARLFNVDLREEWDCPIVFWGGQDQSGTSIYDFFKEYNVSTTFRFDGTRSGGPSLTRDPSRVSPHNAIANLSTIVANEWPKNDNGTPYEPKMHAYKFSESNPTRGSDTAKEIYVCYDEKEYFPSYTYNAEKHVYERWYNGKEQVDGKSGERIVASNVIVQFVNFSFYNNNASRPVYTLTGGGVMDAFIDGRHVRGTWVRDRLADRTLFLDMNGEEITLYPGKTYIQLLPMSYSFTYISDNGTENVMNVGTEVSAPVIDDVGAGLDEMDKME